MKKSYLLLPAIIILLFSGCDKGNYGDYPDPVEVQKEILKNASKYGDIPTMQGAIHAILVLDSTQTEYRDSLMDLYFGTGAAVSTILLGKELLETNPDDTTLLNRMAVAAAKGGYVKDAVDYYTQAYEKTQNIITLYELAAVQYQSNDFDACIKSLQTILESPKAGSAKVVITAQSVQPQKVLIGAAAMNIAGMIAWQRKDAATAEKHFQQALEIDKEFAQAAINLQQLQKILAEGQGQG